MNILAISSYARQGYQMIFGSTAHTSGGAGEFQILDPMSTIVKMAIYNYMPEGTKLCIQNNTIKFDTMNYGKYVQGAKRALWNGAKKDDIHNLHVPIIKAIEWYLNESNQKIFRLSIQGLKKLNELYSGMNTPAASVVSQALVLNVNVIKYNLKNMQNNGDIDPEIQLFDSDETDNDNPDPELIQSMIIDNAPAENDSKQHDIHNQLKTLWTEEEITLIINLFTKLDSKKTDIERKGYLDAIYGIIKGKDIIVMQTIEKITTRL